ncbi:MAG: sulfite exporter TauE/SafE family protein [Candidatus Peribacteraceae bacterium]|nr:sulfite exporter TauE/SafE family protein [Candidatus Peribacteraceae bacterium]
MSVPSEKRQVVLHIGGMTCGSCELLLERKIKTVPGVTHVSVQHRKGTATITAFSHTLPSFEKLEAVIRGAGYRVVTEQETLTVKQGCSLREEPEGPDQQKWLEIGGALIIIFAIYKLLSAYDLISLAPSTAGALTFGGTLLIGVVAGMSSCLAVTGGLLLAMAAKYNELHGSETPTQRLKPLIQFNIGRLASYFVLGGVVGLLGQSITLSTQMTGTMSIVVALVMLYLALTILKIIPKGSLPIHPPKAFSHWIADLSENNHPAAPFALGALTFFLPCGFTQSLQLVALASGSFWSGGLTMFTFALGTLPALLGISYISANARGASSRLFLRFAGTLVLILSLFNLNNGLAIIGVDVPQTIAASFGSQNAPGATLPSPAATVQNGAQEVSMAVTGYGYEPSELTVRAGIPVRFHVDGSRAGGCTRGFVIPSLGIQKVLAAGDNVFEFTPQSPGRIPFSCSMGMVRGSFTVI